MKDILLKQTHVPKFMSCADFQEPELNYIMHYQEPRLMAEVVDSFMPDELEEIKDGKFLYKVVELHDGEKDLLIVVDFLDKEYLENKGMMEVYEGVMSVLDEMAEWHKKEMEELYGN